MKKLIPTIGAITGLLLGMPCLNAGGPELKIERSVKVSFDSEVGKSYKAYSTTDVAKKKWELLGGPADGTGDKIVFFYQSDDDQKVFFKVDEVKTENSKDSNIVEDWKTWWEEHKNNFYINLLSLDDPESDIYQIKSSDIGEVKIEFASIPDTEFKGTVKHEDTPGILTINFLYIGKKAELSIRMFPGIHNKYYSEHSFWYGSFVIIGEFENLSAVNFHNRGNFWLEAKGEE
jgi:hypothetical protein